MRYAAKMIFEYTVAGDVRKRRTCESRIVLFHATSAESALRKAKARGVREQTQYRNVEGNDARIRFLGLADLIKLDPECAPDEAWYSVFSSAKPANLVRKNKELSAFRPLPSAIGAAIRFAPAEPTTRRKKRRANKRRA